MVHVARMKKMWQKNFFFELPDDVQCLTWKLCFDAVVEDLKSKFYCYYPPTHNFLKSLRRDDRIMFKSDCEWTVAYFDRLSAKYFNGLPYYFVFSTNGDYSYCVNPVRAMSRIVLRRAYKFNYTTGHAEVPP